MQRIRYCGVLSPNDICLTCPLPRLRECHGRGCGKNRRGWVCEDCCKSWDITGWLHFRTLRSCSCLYKIWIRYDQSGFLNGRRSKCFLFLCFYMQFLCTAWVLLKTKWSHVHTHKHTQANTQIDTHSNTCTCKQTHSYIQTITLADIHRDRHTYTQIHTHADRHIVTQKQSLWQIYMQTQRQTDIHRLYYVCDCFFSPCISGPGLVTVALWFLT